MAVRPKPFVWAVVACAALWLLACGSTVNEHESDAQTARTPDSAESASDPIWEVDTDRVRRGSVVQRISAPASIVSLREAMIGPEVRGPIVEMFVREGDRVAAGDPLFQIDPEPFELIARRSEAALDRARAERKQFAADLERARELQRQNIKAVEETRRLATQLDVASALEREAGEALAMARRDLTRSLVRAPFAGSVTSRLVDEGTTALVQPQTIVVILQEIHQLEAIATVAEIHFAAIRTGDVALLHIDGLPQPIRTTVQAVGDSIDPASRTFRVRMPVDNADYQLKAGVFAHAEILPSAKNDVLLAPRDAVRSLDGKTHVLALREGRAAMAPIEIGLISEDAVEVLSGLRVDDEVIVGESARTLGPGVRVRSRSRAAAEHADPEPEHGNAGA